MDWDILFVIRYIFYTIELNWIPLLLSLLVFRDYNIHSIMFIKKKKIIIQLFWDLKEIYKYFPSLIIDNLI